MKTENLSWHQLILIETITKLADRESCIFKAYNNSKYIFAWSHFENVIYITPVLSKELTTVDIPATPLSANNYLLTNVGDEGYRCLYHFPGNDIKNIQRLKTEAEMYPPAKVIYNRR